MIAMSLRFKTTRVQTIAAVGVSLFCVLAIAGCGRPTVADEPVPPLLVKKFDELFAKNCSGCHGAAGNFGPAPPLNDPLFLEIMPEAEFTRTVREGRKGTLMPAFARAAGGTLTDEQVSIISQGIRKEWAKAVDIPPAATPDYLPPAGANNPPSQSNVEAGEKVFVQTCAGCHGKGGVGGKMAGPLRNAAFLSLISDQALRRIVITGRPDLGMPNFVALGKTLPGGQPLTNEQIADVVALLASWRTPDTQTRTTKTAASQTARPDK
ncbi:MAG TPA: cytochrome c [Pirellulales bacterium]